MKRGFYLLVPVFTLFVGLGIGLIWPDWEDSAVEEVLCRPSFPEQLDAQPAVLFWGNSLAFDHGWSVPGHTVVNCAVQGLTAKRAEALTEKLPDMAFSSVVLVFGSVELLRDGETPDDFKAALQRIRTTLGQAYPEARVIVAGIPTGDTGWRYGQDIRTGQLNAILRDLDQTTFLSLTEALSQVPEPRRSYDGVHLSATSYAAAQEALLTTMGLSSQ